jgi:hypothetical protein
MAWARRIHQCERPENLSIESSVTRKKLRSLELCVSPDEEVSENPCPFAALLAIDPPKTAGQETRFAAQRFDPNVVLLEELFALSLVLKVDTQLSIDKITNHK